MPAGSPAPMTACCRRSCPSGTCRRTSGRCGARWWIITSSNAAAIPPGTRSGRERHPGAGVPCAVRQDASDPARRRPETARPTRPIPVLAPTPASGHGGREIQRSLALQAKAPSLALRRSRLVARGWLQAGVKPSATSSANCSWASNGLSSRKGHARAARTGRSLRQPAG